MDNAQVQKWQTLQDGLEKMFRTSDPVPKPGRDEVLVKIKAVSLNYRDTEGTSTSTQNMTQSCLFTEMDG